MKAVAIILGVIVVVFAAAWVWGLAVTLPGEQRTPTGLPRNTSTYVTTADGTRLAVEVWLPRGYAGQKLPSIFRATRYGRAMELAPVGRLLARYGLLRGTETGLANEVEILTASGFVYVIADGRGTGASFGTRRSDLAPEEISGYADVVDWMARQPWSNGAVGAWGISQDGDNVELVASLGRAPLKAIAPLYISFDSQLETIGLGGIYNRESVRIWADRNKLADANQPTCPSGDWACWVRFKLLYRGAKPVDGPEGHQLLAQAVLEHRNYDVFGTWGKLQYRDDKLGDTNLTMADIMPFGALAKLEASGIPYLSIFGWEDAGLAQGALNRFLNNRNPMEITIGPWSHGGEYISDPFRPVGTVENSAPVSQLQEVAAFFKTRLGANAPLPKRFIKYNVLGTDTWHVTEVWPPEGFTTRTYYFSSQGGSIESAPVSDQGADTYIVDYGVGTGATSRYRSIVSATDIRYPDRAAQTAKLLHYDTEPMSGDEELTGSVLVKLFASSSREDAAFFVYLDDVAPNGAVTYLTEGVLRGLFHKTASAAVDYQSIGVNRSFYAAAAEPLVPGKTYEIDMDLFPVSALIRQGHRLRVSIAGADGDSMPRIPADGPAPEIRINRNAAAASRVEVPLRPYSGS